MTAGYLSIQGGNIHYLKFGTGHRLLIILHGFGADAGAFLPLEAGIKNEYTTYVLDLPFHGGSIWQKDYFDKKDILELIEMIKVREAAHQYALLGHSLGGRIILALMEEIGIAAQRIYLFAPDGIRTRWLGWSFWIPARLKKQMEKWLQKPERLVKIAQSLRQKGWIHPFALRFLTQHLATEESRRRLFGIWHSIPNFSVRPGKVKRLLQHLKIPLYLMIGRRDKVIRVWFLKRFAGKLPMAKIYWLNCNHFPDCNEIGRILRLPD